MPAKGRKKKMSLLGRMNALDEHPELSKPGDSESADQREEDRKEAVGDLANTKIDKDLTAEERHAIKRDFEVGSR